MSALLNEFSLPTFARDESLTTQEQTYQHLRYALMVGGIEAGESLTIRGLATVMDVSPTPVREALRRLSAEGALQVLDNRRVVCPEMNLNRFDELIKLRIVLECHAAESVLPYVNEVQIDELERLDNQMDMKISKDDHESIVVHNLKFHSMLYKLNPNQVVMPMIESVWLQLGPYSRAASSELDKHYLIDHHKGAIEALRNRSASDLKKEIEADVMDGLGNLGRKKLLENING